MGQSPVQSIVFSTLVSGLSEVWGDVYHLMMGGMFIIVNSYYNITLVSVFSENEGNVHYIVAWEMVIGLDLRV